MENNPQIDRPSILFRSFQNDPPVSRHTGELSLAVRADTQPYTAKQAHGPLFRHSGQGFRCAGTTYGAKFRYVPARSPSVAEETHNSGRNVHKARESAPFVSIKRSRLKAGRSSRRGRQIAFRSASRRDFAKGTDIYPLRVAATSPWIFERRQSRDNRSTRNAGTRRDVSLTFTSGAARDTLRA